MGQSVAQGDTIGSVGTTALAEAGEVYHLHFAMRPTGRALTPRNICRNSEKKAIDNFASMS